MLQKIEAFVWAGNRKWYTLGAIVVVGLMMYFGVNEEWIVE